MSRTSSENVKDKWHPEVKHYAPNVPIILVGTKLDAREDESKSKDWKERPVPYLEVTKS